MNFEYLILVVAILVVVLILRLIDRWIDRYSERRLGVGIVIVLGAAIAFQWKYPEIVARLVG